MEFDNPMVWVWSFVMWLFITVLIWKLAGSTPLKMKIFFTIIMAFVSFFMTEWQADK